VSIASDTYTMTKLAIDHLQATIDSLRDENAKLRAERDTWKANHDNMVYLNRLLRDRPDMAERARLVDELISHRDASRAFSQLMDRENKALTAERDALARAVADAEVALGAMESMLWYWPQTSKGKAALERFRNRGKAPTP
jgi:phage shock protein A